MKKSLAILALVLVTPAARAEEKAPRVTRKMIHADELPYGDEKKLAPAQVSLPGAREGGAVPASWKDLSFGGEQAPSGRCFDARSSSVVTYDLEQRRTRKIVTIDGKDFLDEAIVSVAEGKVKVKEATRTPVMKLVEAAPNVAVWGYRRKRDRGAEIVFLAAIDHGVFDRAISYGCSLDEFSATLPTQSLGFSSSATEAFEVAQKIWKYANEAYKDKDPKPSWVGENYRVEASTSKSAADPAPMVSIYLRR